MVGVRERIRDYFIGSGTDITDDAELINGQVEGLIRASFVGGNVPIGGEDNGNLSGVRVNDGLEGKDNGFSGEDGVSIHRHDKSPDVFPTYVADTSGRSVGGNGRNVSSFANVAFADLEPERGMITDDGLRDFVKAVEWIICHL